VKKVLILAYDFPPYVSVGAMRPYSWLLYFKEYGLYPIVITRQWDNKYGNELDYIAPSASHEPLFIQEEYGTIIKSPYFPNISNSLLLKYGNNKYVLFRKLVSFFYEITQYFFFTGPKSQIYLCAQEYLKENKVSFIIATGEPFVLFKYADALSEKFKIPWIADYRDPWVQDKSRGDNVFRVMFDSYLESKFVSSASLISTVSEFFESQIKLNLPDKTFFICPNGFETSKINDIKSVEQNNSVLSIGFVGTVYKWHPIELFLKTVHSFLENYPERKLRLRFYGTNIKEDDLNRYFVQYPKLSASIELFPKIQNIDLLKKMSEDNVLLLFNYYSYMGTKIYDYLAVRRCILFCFKNDSEAEELRAKYYNMNYKVEAGTNLQEELILKTNSGIIVNNSKHLLEVLEEIYKEFEMSGMVKCNSINIENYSRKKQVEYLSKKIINLYSLPVDNYEINSSKIHE
jgi:hypothetical protein